ncbi:hypothetical protein IFT84_13635 [Rhizobium sp. CFBP 8762]|uniref:hypothetical protein n=1 Tax=Rhizobium sp. CFBP 8762 TaxID=2775279 RepID=UPI00177FD5D0|nr:hypothetical protein [Rhizobium sp. CFBP 8762]MBD8555549.1 hypothetical protein [Rhizobium sp. CFBP 8762]
MFHRFIRSFEFNHPTDGKITYPRGWAGELDSLIASEAEAAGALFVTGSPFSETEGATVIDATASDAAVQEAKAAAAAAEQRATASDAAVSSIKAAVKAVNDAKVKVVAAGEKKEAKQAAENLLLKAEADLATLTAS